jgi:predicted  nucleic acid-binding Zn-ribbon protein
MSKIATLVLNYIQTIEVTKDLEYRDHARELSLAHLSASDLLREEVQKIKNERDQFSFKYEELGRTKAQAEGRLQLVQQEVESEKKRMESLDAEKSKLQNEVDQLKSENSTAQTKLQRLTVELETLKKSQGSTSSKVDNERRVLELQIREMNTKRDADKTVLSRLEREKTELKENEKKLKSEVTDLKAKLQRQTEQTDKVVREQDKLQQKFSTQKSVLESKIETLRTKVKNSSPIKAIPSLMSPVPRRAPTSVMTVGRSVLTGSGLSPTRPRLQTSLSPTRSAVRTNDSLQSPEHSNALLGRPNVLSTVKKSTFSTTPFLARTTKKLLFEDPTKTLAAAQASPTPGASLQNDLDDPNLSSNVNNSEELVPGPLFSKEQPISQSAVILAPQVPASTNPIVESSSEVVQEVADQKSTHQVADDQSTAAIESASELLTDLNPSVNTVPPPEAERPWKPRLSFRSETSFTATTQNNKKISLFDDEESVVPTVSKSKKGKRKLKATVDSASIFDEDGPDQPGSMFKRVKSSKSSVGTGLEKPISPRKRRNQGFGNVFKV